MRQQTARKPGRQFGMSRQVNAAKSQPTRCGSGRPFKPLTPQARSKNSRLVRDLDRRTGSLDGGQNQSETFHCQGLRRTVPA